MPWRRGHSCALFENGRMMCFGIGLSGQLGTVYANVDSVASCGGPKCLQISLASYISFSDNTIPVIDIQAGFDHTCGMFREAHIFSIHQEINESII